ncbi:MAG: cobalt-precorrin 5A hydrolase [Nitrospirota bacterium]
MTKLAIIAITRGGSDLARKIRELYPDGAEIYMPKKFLKPGEKDAHPLSDDLAADMKKIFGRYKSIACIMAAGIVVRLLAPLVRDKRTDPAVIVMDEEGRFVISLLSGHMGGANELAETLAGITGGKAVITTASDVRDTLAVDTLAQKLGCAVEDYGEAKRVTAAIVNGEEVAAWSYMPATFKSRGTSKIPGNLRLYDSLDEVLNAKRDCALIISPYTLPDGMEAELSPVAVLRPRVFVVGIGCNKGTTAREIGNLVARVLRERGLSPLSVRNLATICDKKNEAGITEFAINAGLRVEYISKRRLLAADTPSGPSEKVFRNMGVYGVCEPAALISAGADTLLAPKKKSRNATAAVAQARSA